MLIESLSTALLKAFQNGNCQDSPIQGGWSDLNCVVRPPTEQATAQEIAQISLPTTDGVYDLVGPSDIAPNKVRLFPYAEGPPGSTFSMRLYGWSSMGGMPDATDPRQVFIPYLIVELLCVTCARSGPSNEVTGPGPSQRFLLDSEYLCDTITLTQGVVGPTGYINSTGAQQAALAAAQQLPQFGLQQLPPASQQQQGLGNPWSTNLIAYAVVELGGSRFIQFDFSGVDPVNMNCLWARA